MSATITTTVSAETKADKNLPTLMQLLEKLPAQVKGWNKSATTDLYTPDTLFKYINGGAELYISYNFLHLAARLYKKEGVGEIKIDIFDMSNSQNAFGVFQHSREEVDNFVAPDVESEYAGGLLTFWKGRYYISILAYPETDEKREVVQTVAKKLAELITDKSEKPALLDYLPKKRLIDGSIRYFYHYIWLNSHFFISDKNILNLDKETDAMLAKYRMDDDKTAKKATILLLVTYPGKEKASEAYKSFIANYIPDAKNGFKELEDKRWTGCLLSGNMVQIVLNAPDLAKANELLNQIKR